MDLAKRKRAEQVFERVLKTIKPTAQEVRETTRHSNEIMSMLKEVVDTKVEIQVVGSIARDTNLRGTADIDIFMLFDKDLSKDTIVKKGLSYAKRISRGIKHSRYEVRYAEHPYARLYLDDYNIKLDLVPAYKLKRIEDKGTAVDRTPLHTQFINSNLSDRQRDEVRLLKYLLRAHGIYGAEVKVKGFSGYLCELLIHNFGSLINTMEFFSKVKPPVCIVPRQKKAAADEGLQKKFGSEFVVVDPVDENRNVAAIVSLDSLAKLALVSKMFLAGPNIEAFYSSGVDINRAAKLFESLLESSGSEAYLITLPVAHKTEDVIWPQLNKLSEIILNKIEKSGFTVSAHAAWISADKGNILYLTPKLEISSKLVRGPSAFVGDYALSFIKAHKRAYGLTLKDGIIYAFEGSEYTNVREVVASVINDRRRIKNGDLKLSNFKLNKKLSSSESKEAYLNLMGTLTL